MITRGVKSTPNQPRNRLNMAVSYNKLPRERVSYVAGTLERKHFGEAQGGIPGRVGVILLISVQKVRLLQACVFS